MKIETSAELKKITIKKKKKDVTKINTHGWELIEDIEIEGIVELETTIGNTINRSVMITDLSNYKNQLVDTFKEIDLALKKTK